jgi:hypothetical protein
MEYRPTAADQTARGGRQAALHERASEATRMRFQRLDAEGLTPSRQSLAEFYRLGSAPNPARQTVGMAT